MHPFENKLAADWSPDQWRGITVLVAVSGGADSVALCAALQALHDRGTGRLVVGHFHHGLRGAAADEDQDFVRQLATQWNLPFHTNPPAPPAKRTGHQGQGLEALARRARYDFLTDAAKQLGARVVATAHTADDQIETVWQRLLRGTGPAGLAGIPGVRQLVEGIALRRPLLWARRAEVLEYLQERGQSFRTDHTNENLQFTRNRIRHSLLPELRRQFNRELDQATLRLSQLAADTQSIVERAVEPLWPAAAGDAQETRIDCERLRDFPQPLIREWFTRLWRNRDWPRQAMTYQHWCQLAQMVVSEAASIVLPGALQVSRDSRWLVVSRTRES